MSTGSSDGDDSCGTLKKSFCEDTPVVVGGGGGNEVVLSREGQRERLDFILEKLRGTVKTFYSFAMTYNSLVGGNQCDCDSRQLQDEIGLTKLAFDEIAQKHRREFGNSEGAEHPFREIPIITINAATATADRQSSESSDPSETTSVENQVELSLSPVSKPQKSSVTFECDVTPAPASVSHSSYKNKLAVTSSAKSVKHGHHHHHHHLHPPAGLLQAIPEQGRVTEPSTLKRSRRWYHDDGRDFGAELERVAYDVGVMKVSILCQKMIAVYVSDPL